MHLHWKIRNQRGVSTWWNCLRGHLCALRREKFGEKFGKSHKGSSWAALPEVFLCKPSVALRASLSPSPSSEEIKLDVKIEGETGVRRDHKPKGTNPWLVQVAFAVCSAAKEPPESCRFVGLGLLPIPALLQPGFWDVRTAEWHSATQHVSPAPIPIPYAEHINSSFYSLR